MASDPKDRLPVSINGKRYQIDPTLYRRVTVDATRQLNDQGGEQGEQTLNSAYVWKRSVDDWRLGAGQTYLDISEESQRRRFADSIGIDCWTERSLTLLPEATPRAVATDVGVPAATWLFVVGGRLVYARNLVDPSTYAAVGYSIDTVDDPAAATWTLTELAADTEQLESVCADGSAIYFKVAGVNQLQRMTLNSLGAPILDNIGDNTKGVTNLRIVGGRLIGQEFGAVDSLFEVKAATVATIATYEAGQMPIITGFVAGPEGFYLAGITNRAAASTDWYGTQSVLYRCNVDDTSGALTPPAPVAALPDGEAITTMITYSGFLVLGTSQGVRVGEFTATGGVRYGPVIQVSSVADVVTGTVESASVIGQFALGVQCLEGEGRYVWFGWADKHFVDSSGATSTWYGLGRIDLGRLVEDLQPAYATDLMLQGIDQPVQALVAFRGRRYFTRQLDGVFGQADSFVEQGYIRSGQVTFGTPEPKHTRSIEVRTARMAETCGVTVEVLDEFGIAHEAGSMTGVGAYSYQLDVADLAGESAEVMLRLNRSALGTEAPVLKRWTMRSIVVPARQEEIWLPVILRDKVQHNDRTIAGQDIHGEFTDLRALLLSRIPVVLEMGLDGEAIEVIIDSLATGLDERTRLEKWNATEAWPEGLWFVTCITV